MASPVTSSIVIGRPIGDVFAILTNVDNTEKWFPAKVSEWWTSEPPSEVGHWPGGTQDDDGIGRAIATLPTAR
jgi:uncharacterized protein YndB with AHSA1/START domain